MQVECAGNHLFRGIGSVSLFVPDVHNDVAIYPDVASVQVVVKGDSLLMGRMLLPVLVIAIREKPGACGQ